MSSDLPMLLNFVEDDIDWNRCDAFATSSRLYEACCHWNNGIRNCREIATIMKMNYSTITGYIRKGRKLNIIKEEMLDKNNIEYIETTDMEKYMPEGTKWVFPDGGLFTWVELPGDIDPTELLLEAEKFKVAYVAGEGFYTDPGKGKNCMRLSFGNVTPEKIEIGMERLGKLIASKM